MTGKRQNDGTPIPAHMVGLTGYHFTTGFNNLWPTRGEFGNVHEISNRFKLTEDFPVPFRSDHEPLSYD